MRNEDVWLAIDTLAAEHGLSASALARKAGLDPTSFNMSKRRGPDGRLRWPSTESIAKILEVTGAGLDDFSALVRGARALPDNRGRGRARIPLIDLAQATQGGISGLFDDSGYPTGADWSEADLPSVADPNAYAVSIAGPAMEPAFREGDIVVVSPSTPVRAKDRVIARTKDGEVMVKLLQRHSAKHVELASFNPEFPESRFAPNDISWMHRIIWVSQ